MEIYKLCGKSRDEGSRGTTAKQFVEKSKWLKGPEFLKESEETWLTGDIVESKVDTTDPEVKVNVNVNVVTEKNDILSRLDRFSSLNKAKTAVAISKIQSEFKGESNNEEG